MRKVLLVGLMLAVLAAADRSAEPARAAGTAAVSVGRLHTCALTAAGGVKCWGYNNAGRLGNGKTADSSAPVGVIGLTSGVVAVSAGGGHTCAVTDAAGVECWGRNEYGQLGNGSTAYSSAPVDVIGLSSGVAAISAGWNHTCVVTAVGGAKCWGQGVFGQLGDGTMTDSSAPVDVSGLSGGVAAVSAGGGHTCALTVAGGVKCWGYNNDGQLGNGTMSGPESCFAGVACSKTPVNVSGLTSGVAAVSAGATYTCVVTAAGGVKCWGYNDAGQLGNGTAAASSMPTDVVGLTTGAAAVSAGDRHTCGLTVTGGVKCWGRNGNSQLGDGTFADSSVPVDVVVLASGWAMVGAGVIHTCAVTGEGGVKCWGGDFYGQLGQGTGLAVDVIGLAGGGAAVSAGGTHTCALTTGGGVKCWGWNAYGQLGDGQVCGTTCSLPVDVGGLTSGVATVSAGGTHTCALTAGDGVKCWGSNSYGQLGSSTYAGSSTPVDATGLTSGVAAVSGGGSHTCAVAVGGGVKCWGNNYAGQLGDGMTGFGTSTAVDVIGLSSGVVWVSAGGNHTCAVTVGGGVKCWGGNSGGQLGDGMACGISCSTAVDVMGLTSGVAAASAGSYHTCALTTGGGVKCWGENGEGQLGDGTTVGNPTPVDVSGLASGAVSVSAGGNHACALTVAGGVKCWGENFYGQLGDDAVCGASCSAPVDVIGLSSGAVSVSAGDKHTCAVTGGGGVKCWGFTAYGQLGNGTAPEDVIGLTSGGPDTDGDGCNDDLEMQTAAGSEERGGRRNAKNRFDFYDTNGDGLIDSFNDFFTVAFAFGDDADSVGPGEPDGYDPNLDRSAPLGGEDAWDMHAPDGIIDLFIDIFGVANQFGHDCS